MRRNAGDARHHVARTDDAGDTVDALNAVLEGEDGCALRHQTLQAFRGRLGVAHLHREHDDVGGFDLAGVRRHLDRGEREVAQLRIEPQPLRAHSLQVTAAGDERHVVAGGREAGAEIAADAAGAHHYDLHTDLAFQMVRSAAFTA